MKIKELKGKLPEKASNGSEMYVNSYNDGQDSYAELEVGVDEDKLTDVIYRVCMMKGLSEALTKEIIKNLSEIMVVGK